MFAATDAESVPLPVPDAADVIVMNDALLVAVQLHVLPAPTVTTMVAPAPATEKLVGDTVMLHGPTVRKVSVDE
ncbi:MAG: hypothetical protein DMG01_18900 [Acidobacteria bacterium]|nr:MAG: hypothetical protein DMG01_18900 [Acidobacteriota bacterium]